MVKNIIIVEDDYDIMDLILVLLTSSNNEVMPCTSVKVFRLELEKQVPDLIILDVT